MSRTYRFRKNSSWLEADAMSELVRVGPWQWHVAPIDRLSARGQKRLAKFHSDKKHHWMNWRGPSWFHNTYSQRPHRRRSRREIQKYLLDPEHEVIIESMPHREYWL